MIYYALYHEHTQIEVDVFMEVYTYLLQER